jgi:hypothetical protein
MACADVATAKAKAATAINLIISFSHVLALATNISSATLAPTQTERPSAVAFAMQRPPWQNN